jgi:hypothetical protein
LQLVRHHFKRPGQAVIASLLVGLVLLLDAMAACPSLHELIHHDANQTGHQCAVTMFAHGKVDSVSVEVAAAPPTTTFEFLPLTCISVFSTLVETLPPGRAPPAASAVS